MFPVPTIPESVLPFLWAGLMMAGSLGLTTAYRHWRSGAATTVLESPEYKADRKALLEELRKVVTDEAHQTRELVAVRMDSMEQAIESVRKGAPSREELASLRGRVRELESLNQVFHGVQRASDSGSMPKVAA